MVLVLFTISSPAIIAKYEFVYLMVFRNIRKALFVAKFFNNTKVAF